MQRGGHAILGWVACSSAPTEAPAVAHIGALQVADVAEGDVPLRGVWGRRTKVIAGQSSRGSSEGHFEGQNPAGMCRFWLVCAGVSQRFGCSGPVRRVQEPAGLSWHAGGLGFESP